MDKYNHWIGKLFRKVFGYKGGHYAVTLGQTTYYSCDESRVSLRWKAHEDVHKRQWKRDGKLKFALRYLWQWATKGEIDYETEAETESEAGL